ncbi:MAG: enoyl-CoA hydratase-related protein [bacterium]
MDYETIEVTVEDKTLWVGLNRPKVLNAMNFEMINEVIDAFTRLDEDPGIGVGVLYGKEGNFSSGGDMQMMLNLDAQTGHIWNNKMRRLCMLLRNCGKPAIAMVRGWCIGGGNEWQLYCDLCIASENAKFGQSGARVGALPVVGATQYLPLLVGDRKAREILFLARHYTAQEAKEMNLINEVVPDEKLEETTREWCAAINSHAPMSLRYMKTSLNYLGDLHYSSWTHGSELLNAVWNNDQSAEGMRAFQEKRKPDYSRFPR